MESRVLGLNPPAVTCYLCDYKYILQQLSVLFRVLSVMGSGTTSVKSNCITEWGLLYCFTQWSQVIEK